MFDLSCWTQLSAEYLPPCMHCEDSTHATHPPHKLVVRGATSHRPECVVGRRYVGELPLGRSELSMEVSVRRLDGAPLSSLYTSHYAVQFAPFTFRAVKLEQHTVCDPFWMVDVLAQKFETLLLHSSADICMLPLPTALAAVVILFAVVRSFWCIIY
ncbi:hypothetical protein WUBG_03848 [Wuchereria bancrofti]|uniref:Uncharacterized protein n=1 Tax=Wuchereria bancrofti TaxID=6293 RepID=J9F6T2_WUCBA|nr:hypothetical protein WUBG_03848 [Wuchereria bancrofti]